MPEKKDYYSSYGQKLISLFAKLLFTQRSHSLIELARMLNCSKQTVLRLVDDIRRSYGVEIEEFLEGKRKYYRIKRLSSAKPSLDMTEDELNALYMCKTFSEHLMGKDLYKEATQALEKNQACLPEDILMSAQHFASFRSGSIDYTPHQNAIRTLIEAMDNRKICKISYKSIMAKRAKTFYIKPLKIFSHKDSVYLHAHLARTPGKPYTKPEFNPLLAIHRIKKVEVTERLFTFPKNYDFDRVFKQNFGVIKEDAFEVKVEFTGWAAKFVSERIWSPNQKIVRNNGKTVLTFSTSSEPELISWVLSFGDQAKLIRPNIIVKEIRKKLKRSLDNISLKNR
jgi:predicted DNA-binding transcriptional regulator YafY